MEQITAKIHFNYKRKTQSLLLAMAILFVLSCSPSSNKKAKQKPNIVFIIADDQGYADIGCAGLADDVQTPNLDALAASGVRFTQAYASSPISSPSRAGLITGCYQQRWGTYWYGGKGIHDESYPTIAEILKKEGYSTGYVGKVHYGSNDNDTLDRSFPLNHGFDYYFGHTSPRKHYLHHTQQLEDQFQLVKKEADKWGQSLRQGPLWKNNEQVDTIAFSTELFGTKARQFIDNNTDQPFYLQVAFNAVHNFTHQLPETYLKEKGLKGYHDWDPASEDYYDWYKNCRYPNNPEGREQYLGQLHFLDQEIGRILKQLKTSGLYENTIIVYISDNGGSTPIYANNYPLRGSKYLLYEGGIRVPMIFSWPGKIKENQILDNVVSGLDILPTLCQLSDLPYPKNLDGLDISQLLNGDQKKLEHDTLYWNTGHEKAIRVGNWKYHMATNDQSAKYEMVELELGEFLYNLKNDPGEESNLAMENPDKFTELKDALLKWEELLKE